MGALESVQDKFNVSLRSSALTSAPLLCVNVLLFKKGTKKLFCYNSRLFVFDALKDWELF